MATRVHGQNGISIDRVFGLAFGAMRSNPVVFLGISLLLSALPSLLINAFEISLGYAAPAAMFATKGGWVLMGSVFLIGLFLNALVEGALVRATVDHAHGGRASFGECLAVGLRAAVPLLVLTVLLVIGCYVGLILLVVPGVILYCMWAVAAPALVNERLGIFEAFGRSRALTAGARWKVFAIELIVLVVVMLISAAMGILIGMVMGTGGMLRGMVAANRTGLPWGYLVAQALIATVTTTVWSAIQNALYAELRNWKDGSSAEGLADVFA